MTDEEDLGELVQRLKGQITAISGRVDMLEETGHSNIPGYDSLKRTSHAAADLITRIDKYLATHGLVSGPPKSSVENTVYRVVHVDDEDSVTSIVRDVLTSQKFEHPGRSVTYEVYSYASVDETLSGMRDLGQIDLLITDRQMIGKTGFDLLDAISDQSNKVVRTQEYSGIKNLAMFSSFMPEAELKRLKAYGAAFIEKPINMNKFEQTVYGIITKPA